MPDQPDTISWTLTADGKYSASSAYHAQFVGSHPRFVAQKIWNASAKPKCKLFAWLALHGNLLTADMLVVRGWPHDSACRLCLSALETATHLCKDCPFTMVIWSQVHTWDNADLGAPLAALPLPLSGGTLSLGVRPRMNNAGLVGGCYTSSGMPGKRGTDVSSMANVSHMSRWLQLHARTYCRESELSRSTRLPFRRNMIRFFPFCFIYGGFGMFSP
jgi:hypothetical protein